MSPPPVCTRCGHHGPAKRITRGSTLIELVLWLASIPLFCIPGLLYSLLRLTTRHAACGACGARELVPADSPVGKQLLRGG